MKLLFHFILSHSIFIALCAAALSLQTLQLLSLPVNDYLLAFVFFCYFMWLQCLLDGQQVFIWQAWIHSFFLKKSSSSIIVMFVAAIGMLFCFTKLHLVMYNVVITFVLLGLYAIPVMPFKQLHFTRKAGVVKTVLLAFAWTIVTTLIPLQASIFAIGHAAQQIFVNRFLFMLMLCIIFDKRDVEVDKIRGLQSLATDIKPLLLHYLIGIIFISYSWISYAMTGYGVSVAQVAALLLTGVITMAVYAGSLTKKRLFILLFPGRWTDVFIGNVYVAGGEMVVGRWWLVVVRGYRMRLSTYLRSESRINAQRSIHNAQ